MRIIAPLCLVLLGAPVGAHPHIFVNTGLVALVDAQNRLTHVQVTWEYDELYSLLITEDLGVDSDYDGILTPADLEILTGFDMNWIEGFNGDLEGSIDGVPLVLSQPTAPTAELRNGKVITTHMRAVAGAPQFTQAVEFRPFDITYYTAYDVVLPVSVKGREGCDIDINVPDVEGALAMIQAEIAALPESYDMDAAGFGDVGAQFATQIEISCAAL